MSKQLAKKEETLPVASSMYEDDAATGSGFEEADKDSYAIPFLSVLQKMSPQVDDEEGAYVEGAKAGMFFNSVTEDLFDGKGGVTIIPCHYSRKFLEFILRENGGGFNGEYDVPTGTEMLKDCQKDEKMRDILPNGHQLVDTREHYVLLVKEDGTFDAMLFSMSSTQIKKSRRWMTVMQNLKMKRGDDTLFTPPMFSHKYQVVTVPESNEKGSWSGIKISQLGVLADDETYLYKAAKDFRDAILSGDAKAAHEPAEEEREPGSDDDEVPGF